MQGKEFIRRVRRLGKERGVEVRFSPREGKGSHGRLYFGDRFATMKDRNKEISPGLQAALLRQLGLRSQDLNVGGKKNP